MGTRSLTYIKEKNDALFSINIYKHMDGYPDGWGVELADFFDRKRIVRKFGLNGVGSPPTTSLAKDTSCLIAQLIAEKKEGIGGLYVYAPHHNDCGQEYEYRVEVCDASGNVQIEITEIVWEGPNKVIFKGTPLELIKKYEPNK